MKCQATELEIETIVNRIENGDMDLQPDFQRGEIWPPQKKKKLIDSILRGWRIPPIHVVPNAKDVDEVLDGQQRLAAIRDFYGNKFPIDGNIEPQDEVIVALDGYYYENLSPEWQRRFKKYSINLIRLTEYKPAEPAELFYRLNQPSSLTSAEQRNAYLGITRDQIKSLANAFTSYGATPELIGFSNSRLAYDEIISKFCYVVESETLKKKVTSTEISEKYRKGIPFSDECVEIVGETLIKFMDCIKHVDIGIFFVEDKVAEDFLAILLNDRLPRVFKQYSIESVGGESHISERLKFPKSELIKYRFVGIYDGDMKKTLKKEELEWDYCFLPGTKAIEEVFRDLLQIDENLGTWCAFLGIPEGRMATILATHSGLDCHDWFNEMRKSLSMDVILVLSQ